MPAHLVKTDKIELAFSGNFHIAADLLITKRCFDLSNSKVTSSEAVQRTLPNIALAEQKKIHR